MALIYLSYAKEYVGMKKGKGYGSQEVVFPFLVPIPFLVSFLLSFPAMPYSTATEDSV